MSEDKALAPKTETALGTAMKMPAGLDGAGSDFLMPRFKVWHPMSKQDVEGAKLGKWYEANGATLVGDSIRFYLLSQKNLSFTQDDGKVKNYKHLLIAKEGQLGFPCEIVLSASGIRPVKALNTTLMERKLSDKSAATFGYLIDASIEIKENENGKFGVPKFTIVGAADVEAFDQLAGLHAQHAVTYATSAAPVDTATAYKEDAN